MIFTMTRVLIMALFRHFIEKFILKFWIPYEHNDFFSLFILNIMTFPLILLWSVWQKKLETHEKQTKRKLQLIHSEPLFLDFKSATLLWYRPRSRWPDQIVLWSDDLHCARITRSGKSFQHTSVSTMLLNLSDQRSLRSGSAW